MITISISELYPYGIYWNHSPGWAISEPESVEVNIFFKFDSWRQEPILVDRPVPTDSGPLQNPTIPKKGTF